MKGYVWFGSPKKLVWPSTKNENPLTWKCKLFGCRNEFLPLTVYRDGGEKHGVKAGMGATMTTTTLTLSYKGCIWCKNYREIIDEEIEKFPGWICDCEVCENSKTAWGWK